MGAGADFQKNFVDFFRTTKLIFRALPNLYKDPVFAKTSAPQAKFRKKKQDKKCVIRPFFGKFWQENRVFFGVRSPLKVSINWRLKKLLGFVTKNGYLKIVQRGDPLGRQGFKSLRGEGVRPPPPKSAPERTPAARRDKEGPISREEVSLKLFPKSLRISLNSSFGSEGVCQLRCQKSSAKKAELIFGSSSSFSFSISSCDSSTLCCID